VPDISAPPGAPARFPALLAAEPDGTPARLVGLEEADLDEGDVTVAIAWSSLNYKDALAVTGRAPVVRRFPMVCGIDLAGRVTASTHPGLSLGDEVVVVGCGLGENHTGGYAGLARVPGSWCVRLPPGLDLRRSMAIGTAGFTAMLAVLALERVGISPEGLAEPPVLVTGAAGGVGSIAVAVLARLGYRVAASTGRPGEAAYLRRLGASEVLQRAELADGPRRSLGDERFSAAIDVVGGETLANVLSQVRRDGAVAACGLAGGGELPASVYPFVLRGVTLAGVNSTWPPPGWRERAWQRLATDLPAELLDEMTVVEPLSRVPELAGALLSGAVRGRVVVEVAG